ncbi:hypothetical protein N7478_013187 [Penicillium angulare]|uniref:uncharacterized protein n=1 Tax=Penicillium angulare TaxID=116970 RepID=UPI00253FFF85|nr:uncharacterized protein N7478_013187 [Penicillium angulare]KAJ5257083.1 hypothetical protein N7478_013187 [Penicillium angulare]
MTELWAPKISITLYSEGPQTDFSRGPHWNHESPFPPLLWESTSPEQGSRSLKSTAIKGLLKDQSALSPEIFTAVPWIIAEDLWDCLKRWCVLTPQSISSRLLIVSSNKQTLYMWKIMVINYAQFREYTPYYRLVADKCKQPIRQYFDLMNNTNCLWRSVLSFSSDFADVTDLVALSNIKNIVALEINQHMRFNQRKIDTSMQSDQSNSDSLRRDGLRDGIVRSWMEMVQTKDSFQHLRILRLYNQKRLSPHTLTMFEKFPQLNIIVLCGCDLFTEAMGLGPRNQRHGFKLEGWIARRLDWIQKEDFDDAEMLQPLLELYNNTLKTGYRCFDKCAEEEDPTPSSLQSSLPLMEFQIPEAVAIPQMEYKENFAAKSIVILVKASKQPSLERKRPTGHISSEVGKKKRVMKDRGGQDLSSVLGQFL